MNNNYIDKTVQATQKSKMPVRFKPALLGVGLCHTALLILLQNSSPVVAQLGAEAAFFFVCGILIGLILAAMITMLANRARGKIAPDKHSGIDGRVDYALAAALIVAVLSIAGLQMVITFLMIDYVIMLITITFCSLALGSAIFVVIVRWGALYANELPESILIHAACSLIVSALTFVMVGLPGLHDLPLIYVGLCVIISVVIVWKGGKGDFDTAKATVLSEDQQGLASDVEAALTIGTGQLVGVSARQLGTAMRLLWKPLLSGSISAFIIGLVWDPVASGSAASTLDIQGLPQLLAAPVVAALIVVCAFMLRPKVFSLHVFIDIVLPVAIAILLVVPLVELEGVDITAQTGFLSQMCFALVVIATWGSVAAGVRTLSMRLGALFALAAALLTLAMLLGLFCIHRIGIGGRVLCLILLTLFLVLMIIDFAWQIRLHGSYREQLKDVLESFLSRRCEQLADSCALSARESEVFLYLARGYGHVYIARELYVSENTIRTHVRHIYAKLGVTSREELLRLVDSDDSEP